MSEVIKTYIQKEAEKYATIQIGDPAKFENNDQINKYENEVVTFSDGLFSGIELAKEFAEWVDGKYFIGEKGWTEVYDVETPSNYTTSELFEMFLKQKGGM